MSVYKVGDRVKVTIEGDVNRVLGFDNGQELRIEVEGTDDFHYVYTDSANIEKVEPEYEVFGVGETLRYKRDHKYQFLVLRDGYVDLRNHIYNGKSSAFTSEHYERVELP